MYDFVMNLNNYFRCLLNRITWLELKFYFGLAFLLLKKDYDILELVM